LREAIGFRNVFFPGFKGAPMAQSKLSAVRQARANILAV